MNFGQATINQILDILQNINTVETQTTPTCNVPCLCPSGQQESNFCPQGEKAELAGTVSCWPCTNPSNKTCYKCVPETPCCNCTTCSADLFDPPEENTPCNGCAVADKCDKCKVAGLPIFCFKCPDEENKPGCDCTDQRCVDQGFYDSRAKCIEESGAAECKTESCSHNCCKGSAACYKPCPGSLPKCNCTDCGMYASKEDCETSTNKKCRKAEFGCETFGMNCCELNKECWEACSTADPCDCTNCGYYSDEQECVENNDGMRCAQIDCTMNEGTNADPCCVKNSDCWKGCEKTNNSPCACATCGLQSKTECEAANGQGGCVPEACSSKNPQDCCKENSDCWKRAPDCKCSMCGYLTKVGCEVECYQIPGCRCEEVRCGCTACDNCIPNDNCAIKKQDTPTYTNTCQCSCEVPGGSKGTCPGSFAGLYDCEMTKQPWEKCELKVCNCSIPGCPNIISTNCYFREYDPSATTTVSISPTVTPTEKCLCPDCGLWNSRNECESDNPGKICVPAHCDSSPPPCILATTCYEVAPTPTPTPSCIFGSGEFKTKPECENDLFRKGSKCQCKECIEGQPTSSGLDPEYCTCTKQQNKTNMTSEECCKNCCNLTIYWNSKEECDNVGQGGAPRECKQATSCGDCSASCASKCWIAEILTPTATDCDKLCNKTEPLDTCQRWAFEGLGRKCEKATCPDPKMACYSRVTTSPTATCACKDIGQGCMTKERCDDLASPAKCHVGPEQGKKCVCVSGCGSGDRCQTSDGQQRIAIDSPCAEIVERDLKCTTRQQCFNTEPQCKVERDRQQAADRSKIYRCEPSDVEGDRCYCITSKQQDCCKPNDRPSDCGTPEDCKKTVLSYNCTKYCRLTNGPSCDGGDSSCAKTTKPCPARPPACPDPNPQMHVYDCATPRSECENCRYNKQCMVNKGTPTRPVPVCECLQIVGSCESRGHRSC